MTTNHYTNNNSNIALVPFISEEPVTLWMGVDVKDQILAVQVWVSDCMSFSKEISHSSHTYPKEGVMLESVSRFPNLLMHILIYNINMWGNSFCILQMGSVVFFLKLTLLVVSEMSYLLEQNLHSSHRLYANAFGDFGLGLNISINCCMEC